MSYPNIEKSKFERGAYVGYGGGAAWHIRKSNSALGRWSARTHASFGPHACRLLFAWRLSDMSEQLAALEVPAAPQTAEE